MVTSNEQSPGRFEKFSNSSRVALTFAEEEARRLNHGYVGTEHILLGLLKEGSVVELLQELGMSPEKIKRQIEFTVIPGKKIAVGKLGLTPGAKKVLELTVDEARRRQYTEFTPIHMLIGALLEEEGVAARVLMDQGEKSPLKVLLDKMRNFNPAVKKPDKAGSQKSDKELPIEAEQVLVTENLLVMEHLARYKAFLEDPSSNLGLKISITGFVTELMNLAEQYKPKSNSSG